MSWFNSLLWAFKITDYGMWLTKFILSQLHFQIISCLADKTENILTSVEDRIFVYGDLETSSNSGENIIQLSFGLKFRKLVGKRSTLVNNEFVASAEVACEL